MDRRHTECPCEKVIEGVKTVGIFSAMALGLLLIVADKTIEAVIDGIAEIATENNNNKRRVK